MPLNVNNVHVSQYLLLPADGAVLSDPLQASTVHGAVPLNLLHLLQGEGDGNARHGQLRPADVVLWTRSKQQVSTMKEACSVQCSADMLT